MYKTNKIYLYYIFNISWLDIQVWNQIQVVVDACNQPHLNLRIIISLNFALSTLISHELLLFKYKKISENYIRLIITVLNCSQYMSPYIVLMNKETQDRNSQKEDSSIYLSCYSSEDGQFKTSVQLFQRKCIVQNVYLVISEEKGQFKIFIMRQGIIQNMYLNIKRKRIVQNINLVV